MGKIEVQAPQPPQGSHQTPTSQQNPTSNKVPSGISAIATQDGEPIYVYTDKWEPVRPGTLDGIPVSQLPEYTMGDDKAWHCTNDPQSGDLANLEGRYLLVRTGQRLLVTAVDHQHIADVHDLEAKLAAVPPGTKVEFSVLDDGQKAVIVRTVGKPKDSAHLSASELSKLLPFIQHGDRSESYGTHVAKFVEIFEGSAVLGINSETKAFSKPQGGRDAVANAAVADAAGGVLREIVAKANKDDQKELVSPMLKELGDHKPIKVPVELVDRAMARLPNAIVRKYGEETLRPAVMAFIKGAMQKTLPEAKVKMADAAKVVQHGHTTHPKVAR